MYLIPLKLKWLENYDFILFLISETCSQKVRMMTSSTSGTCASWRGAQLPFYSSIGFSPSIGVVLYPFIRGEGHIYSSTQEF